MKYLYYRGAVAAFSLATCFFLAISGAAADSIKVGGTTYEDVLVVSSELSYYILLPDEGRTISVPREDVDASQLTISEDEDHRAELRARYAASKERVSAFEVSSPEEQGRFFQVDETPDLNAETYYESTAIDAPGLMILEILKEGPISPGDATIRVVEFWATWCGPCRRSIPRLTELQAEYAPKGVAFIGVTREAPEVAAPYVAKMGDKMNYTVLADYQSRTSFAYSKLFDVTTIPHAYIVDGDGKVAWHGHPMSADFIPALKGLTR